MSRKVGSKDKQPRNRKKINDLNKFKYNCVYVSEFVDSLIKDAKNKGFTFSQILEYSLLNNVNTKKTPDGNFQHILKIKKQIIAETINSFKKPPLMKWQSRKKNNTAKN